jgi:hypothetical protein
MLGSKIHTSYSDCMEMDLDELVFLVEEIKRLADG